MTDPIERIVADALNRSKIAWVNERDPRSKGLDFYLTDFDVHIEVKQFHTPRTAEQMMRSPNVIVIVGRGAAEAFAKLLFMSPDDAETAGEAEALLLEQFGQGRVDGELAEMIPHRRDDDEGADG